MNELSSPHNTKANAFMNFARPNSESWWWWAVARGLELNHRLRCEERGAYGRPRKQTRCEWPIGPCVAGCTALHVDGDALDAAQVAA